MIFIRSSRAIQICLGGYHPKTDRQTDKTSAAGGCDLITNGSTYLPLCLNLGLIFKTACFLWILIVCVSPLAIMDILVFLYRVTSLWWPICTLSSYVVENWILVLYAVVRSHSAVTHCLTMRETFWFSSSCKHQSAEHQRVHLGKPLLHT